MALLTIREIFDLVVMTGALGYIFMSYVRQPGMFAAREGFDWNAFWFAMGLTAPGIVFHELSHKFVALAFGMIATFHASYFGLALGLFLKMVNSPFVIFAPGFVEMGGGMTVLGTTVSAFAGPAMNLLLFFIAKLVLARKRRVTQRQFVVWHLTKQVNLFLFLFNMIPLPPFDGAKVFSGLLQLLF